MLAGAERHLPFPWAVIAPATDPRARDCGLPGPERAALQVRRGQSLEVSWARPPKAPLALPRSRRDRGDGGARPSFPGRGDPVGPMGTGRPGGSQGAHPRRRVQRAAASPAFAYPTPIPRSDREKCQCAERETPSDRAGAPARWAGRPGRGCGRRGGGGARARGGGAERTPARAWRGSWPERDFGALSACAPKLWEGPEQRVTPSIGLGLVSEKDVWSLQGTGMKAGLPLRREPPE